MQESSHGDFSLPGPNMHTSASAQRKPSWQSQRLSSVRSMRSGRSSHASTREPAQAAEQHNTVREDSQRHTSTATSAHSAKPKWWHVHLFRGMVDDVKRRAPYYWSDWIDAWDYRVIPATVYMYFAKYGLSAIFNALWINWLLILFVVSCLLWLSLWICLRRLVRVTG